jgi:SAM-dependent methyltransferase
VEDADSAEFIYGTQESLSAGAQPGIYRPWDGNSALHFRLRGRLLDWGAVMAGRRVLDFGPGEGYPSLGIAPFVEEVVGVDGSAKRVAECSANAERMGIANATFVHVPPGDPLPLPDASFDGAVASWSLEQSPDLRMTLREICRVLRPGGIFRFEPETLGRYAGAGERQVWLPAMIGGFHGLAIFDRDIAAETVTHYGLLLNWDGPNSGQPVLDALSKQHGCAPPLSVLTEPVMESLRPHIVRAGTWTTDHPSFAAWPTWLNEAGFGDPRCTYSGGWTADRAFNRLAEHDRPRSLQAMDALLAPMAAIAYEMDAPVPPPCEDHLFVTAVKGEQVC